MMQLHNNPVAKWWTLALRTQMDQSARLLDELAELHLKALTHVGRAMEETTRLTAVQLRAMTDMQSDMQAALRTARERATGNQTVIDADAHQKENA
ncbi:MAG: hypothetical protein AAF411_12250 [Myxococcota bacterium]